MMQIESWQTHAAARTPSAAQDAFARPVTAARADAPDTSICNSQMFADYSFVRRNNLQNNPEINIIRL